MRCPRRGDTSGFFSRAQHTDLRGVEAACGILATDRASQDDNVTGVIPMFDPMQVPIPALVAQLDRASDF